MDSEPTRKLRTVQLHLKFRLVLVIFSDVHEELKNFNSCRLWNQQRQSNSKNLMLVKAFVHRVIAFI